jgi:monoamine oxidase
MAAASSSCIRKTCPDPKNHLSNWLPSGPTENPHSALPARYIGFHHAHGFALDRPGPLQNTSGVTRLHSPLSAQIREAHAACTEAHSTGAPIDEVVAWRAERRMAVPRRAILAGVAASVAVPARRARAADAPKVVIVGAGLAGLACARALWVEHGIPASIYEWSGRVGGRVQTLRGYFADGITAEQHGQFISSEHRRMRRLAAISGLSLADANIHLGKDTNDTGWYRGARYTYAQLAADWQKYAWRLFRKAHRAAPFATWQSASPAARRWDNMSVTDWVRTYIPGGLDNPLGGLCLADVISEYGSAPDRQSALNLIYILGEDASRPDGMQPRDAPEVAGTNEKFQVVGGNDLIVSGLVGDLPQDTINLGNQLLAVRQTPSGRLVCSFQAGAGTVDVRADHVVLTIPPTTLRDVALTNIPLMAVQERAIAGATLGKNAKIFMQVKGRPWVADGYDGTVLTDQAVCGGWDAGNTQPGGRGAHANGMFVGYPGGEPGESLARRYGLTDEAGPAPAALVNDTLAQLEPIFPGMTAAWQTGPQLAYVNDGNIDPYLRGAYSNFLVGQYTSFCGAQSLPAGNVHFAGEHTSVEYQGYMEGAVQSGLRAAREIVDTLR